MAGLPLILLCLILFWPGQRTIPAIDRDEARFAQASRQMAASGDIVDIRFQDETRYKKPAGIYWLQASSARLLGEDRNNPVWPYRLPSLLGAIGAVLATFALGQAAGGMLVAWMGAVLLAMSLLLGVEARLATVDACLLCCCTVWLACLNRVWTGTASRSYRLAFWTALGCGVLLKGPVLPVLALLTISTLCILKRDWRWLAGTRPFSGITLMAAIVLPWLVAIALRSHGAFFAESLGHDLGGKLAGAQESHGGFPGLYLLEFPLAFFPGSVLTLAALPAIWRRRREPETAFLLAWIVPGWLMMEFVPTRLPHYVLPFYPAIALLTAMHSSVLQRAATPRVARTLSISAGTVVLVYGLVFGLIVPQLQTPFIARTLVRHRASYAADVRHGTVAFAGFHEPSAVLWFGTGTALDDPTAAALALQSGSVSLAYVSEDAQPEFLKSAPFAEKIDSITGFNIARGRMITIAVYRLTP